jgi:AraC-like DNA-binding protein
MIDIMIQIENLTGMTLPEKQAVLAAAEILENEFVNPPLQQNLSKRVGLNLNKLSFYFQQIYGQTINKYVLKLKLEKARSLLSQDRNRFTVTAVANEVGFNNTSYFIRKFREAYGETPGEYYDTEKFPQSMTA